MPAPHGLHVVDEFAAVAKEKYPAAHGVQVMLPVSEYVPGGHAVSELRDEVPRFVVM